MRLHGGEGSIYAVLDELPEAAAKLELNALALQNYQTSMLRMQANSGLDVVRATIKPWCPIAVSSISLALAQSAQLQAQALGAQLVSYGLARGLQRSHQAYVALEQQLASQFNELMRYPALISVVAKLAAGQRPGTQETEIVLNNLPAFAGEAIVLASPLIIGVGAALGGPIGATVAGTVVMAAPSMSLLRDKRNGGLFDTTVSSRLLGSLTGAGRIAGILHHGPIQVEEVRETRQRELKPELVGVLDILKEASSEEQSLVVTSVEKPDGSVAAIVTFPGTHAAHNDGTEPFDASGIHEAKTLGSQHISASVLDALDQAQVPEGSQVILSGYSQGGMHAVNIAADSRFNEKYEPAMVISVGAPVGQLTEQLPSGLKTLHLEHRQDPVPGLDGRSNPHTADRLTLEVDGYGVETPPNTAFGPGHNLENYLNRYETVVNHGSPELKHELAGHEAALAGIIGVGSVVTSRTIKLKREPVRPSFSGQSSQEPLTRSKQ